MDLSIYKDRKLVLERSAELFKYQPFVLSDECRTGAALGQLYGRRERVLFRSKCDKSLWDSFSLENDNMARMYETFLAETKGLIGGFENKTFLDIACNAGYFCYRALQEGAKNSTGIDSGDYAAAFNLVNNIINVEAVFIRRSYDIRRHIIEDIDPADIVFCTSFMCHISDPTFLLAFLADVSKKALLIYSKFPRSDEYFIKYSKKTSLYTKYEFPLCFDGATEISDTLLLFGLKELGFIDVHEINRGKYWLPRGDSWRCFLAIRK